MIWILFVIMSGSGKALTSVEFNSESACRKAQTELKAESGLAVYVNSYCFEKGTK